ncbi:MAG: SIS domain-containing protein, partial [Bacteroidales bacterium]|nr:SIS domain-containing protein [Bacteroidales bacterium]
MITIERMRQAVAESIATKQRILEDSALMSRLEEASKLVAASLRQGGKIHFCGNGGSAADAQHLAAELSGRFYYDRPP